MIKTIFFSVLFLSIIFFSFILWDHLRDKSPKTTEEKKVVKKGSPWILEMLASLTSAMWAAFCIVAVSVFVGWLLLSFLENNKANRHTAPKGTVLIMPGDIKLIEDVQNQSHVVEKRRGTLSWHKPEDVHGGDPNLRNYSMKTKIIRNDKSVMEFTAEYEYHGEKQVTHFRWNKSEEYGTWSQDYPQADGHWRLNRVSDSVFEGEQSNSSGTSIPMKLELI